MSVPHRDNKDHKVDSKDHIVEHRDKETHHQESKDPSSQGKTNSHHISPSSPIRNGYYHSKSGKPPRSDLPPPPPPPPRPSQYSSSPVEILPKYRQSSFESTADNTTTKAVLSASFMTEHSHHHNDLQYQRLVFVQQFQERLEKSQKGIPIDCTPPHDSHRGDGHHHLLKGQQHSRSDSATPTMLKKATDHHHQQQHYHHPMKHRHTEMIDKLLSESDNDDKSDILSKEIKRLQQHSQQQQQPPSLQHPQPQHHHSAQLSQHISVLYADVKPSELKRICSLGRLTTDTTSTISKEQKSSRSRPNSVKIRNSLLKDSFNAATALSHSHRKFTSLNHDNPYHNMKSVTSSSLIKHDGESSESNPNPNPNPNGNVSGNQQQQQQPTQVYHHHYSITLSELTGGGEFVEDYDSDYWEDERLLLKWEARRAGVIYLGIEELEKHQESMKLTGLERMKFLMK